MRDCPFCGANATRQRIIEKYATGRDQYRRRVAYVTCLSCFARGPIARGLEYDIRNERPSMGAAQLLREHAMQLWDGDRPEESEDLALEFVRRKELEDAD